MKTVGEVKIKLDFVFSLVVFMMLFASMTLMRLRLANDGYYHFGGAELAIAPIDLVVFVALFSYLLFGKLKVSFLNYLDWLAVLYVFLMFFSILSTSDLNYTMYEIVRQIKYFFVYLIIKAFFVRKCGFLWMVVFIVLVQFFVSLVQVEVGVTISGDGSETELNLISGGVVRAVGTLGHPGVLAQYINIISMFLFSALVFLRVKKVWVLSAFLLSLYILVVTYSRTAMVVEFVLCLVMAVFSIYSGWNKFGVKNVFLGLSFLSLVFLYCVLNYDALYERFFLSENESGEIRLVLMDIAFEMIKESPFLGVGLNAFTEVMSLYDKTMISSYWPMPVHNIYLLVASELGVLGLITFILVITSFIFSGLRIICSLGDRYVVWLAAASVWGLFAILFYGLLGWSWRLDSIQFLFWLCLAGVSASFDTWATQSVERD